MTKQENRNTGGAVGPGQEQKLSPRAEQLVRESLPHAPKDGSIEAKTAFVEELKAKLVALREFEKFDPLTMESVVLKRGYREVAELQGHTDWVDLLQALPDGRIVSGSDDNTLRVWTRGADDTWSSEVLSGHTPQEVESGVHCLQALPDGRIVSGSYDSTLRVWTRDNTGVIQRLTKWLTDPLGSRGADKNWSSEVLSGHTGWVFCLQALPDGRIVSGSEDFTNGEKTLRVWTRGARGKWSSEVLRGHTRGVDCLQALPDGRIVSGSLRGRTLRIWDGTPVEGGTP